jgi:hypothetical protein
MLVGTSTLHAPSRDTCSAAEGARARATHLGMRLLYTVFNASCRSIMIS